MLRGRVIFSKQICLHADVDPPIVQCPKNIHAFTELNENYAIVLWDEPYTKGMKYLLIR